jgi:hypothetical protein
MLTTGTHTIIHFKHIREETDNNIYSKGDRNTSSSQTDNNENN